MLSWRYAVPESSFFQESCSGSLHRRQSLRTLPVQQQSYTYRKRRLQHSVALVCLIKCWSLLSVVSHLVPADSLSSASASIHPSSVATITTGLIHFTLVYFSFNWIQLVGFFHLSPQLAFHLLQQFCLSYGDEPTVTFILRATVRFSLCLICFFFLLSVFDFLFSGSFFGFSPSAGREWEGSTSSGGIH